MVQENELAELFEDYGFELSPEIIAQCDVTEPTLESLQDFERKELARARNKPVFNASKHTSGYETQFNAGNLDDDDDLMGEYIGKATKIKNSIETNELERSSIAANVRLSPSTTNAISGQAICTFGKAALIKDINWSASKSNPVKVTQVTALNGKILGNDALYMYDTLLQRCYTAADGIYDIGQDICAKLINDFPDEFNQELLNNLANPDEPSQGMLQTIGRISSDSDCELSATSTVLIGSDEMRLRTVRLYLNNVKSCALFPGQTVFIQGINPRGDTLFVERVCSDRMLTHSAFPTLSENVSIVTAAGPFTTADDFSFESLNEIIAYCKHHKPDVLILLGPFIEAEHKVIVDGTVKTAVDMLFETLIVRLMDTVGKEIEVLIVSSSRDIHSTAVYPTHSYNVRSSYRNLTFLPDPCTVKINGVTISITAADILSDIIESELTLNAGDKIKRSVNHLFNQASFYPLNPASKNASVDIGLCQTYAAIPIVPNILIISSNLKPFIREITSCLFVNPGQTVVNSSNGTFNRIVLTPAKDSSSLSNFFASQVVKF